MALKKMTQEEKKKYQKEGIGAEAGRRHPGSV